MKMIFKDLVCDDCAIAIANNDFTGMDKTTETRVRDGLTKLFTRNSYAAVGNDAGFSHRQCYCCESSLAGNRHELNIIFE